MSENHSEDVDDQDQPEDPWHVPSAPSSLEGVLSGSGLGLFGALMWLKGSLLWEKDLKYFWVKADFCEEARPRVAGRGARGTPRTL